MRHRREPRQIHAALERELGLEAHAVPLGATVRPLEKDEMLHDLFAEGRELDDDSGGQRARVERKIAAAEARRAAERRRDVPHRREMPHLLERDAHDRAAPARNGLGFALRQTFGRSVAQTEGRIEIRAHQVVLELGGLVERVHEPLTRRCRNFSAHSRQYQRIARPNELLRHAGVVWLRGHHAWPYEPIAPKTSSVVVSECIRRVDLAFVRRSGAAEAGGHVDELGEGARLHLAHQLPAVRLDGDLGDSELAADLLVEPAGNDELHDLSLAPAQRLVAILQRPHGREVTDFCATAFDGLANRLQHARRRRTA